MGGRVDMKCEQLGGNAIKLKISWGMHSFAAPPLSPYLLTTGTIVQLYCPLLLRAVS